MLTAAKVHCSTAFNGRTVAQRITWCQLGILFAIAVPLLVIGQTPVLSFVTGALIQIGPAWWFTRQAFRYTGASQTLKIVRSMYLGEIGKIIMTAILFALVFVLLKPLDISTLFSGYIMMLLIHVYATAMLLRQGQQEKVN